MSRNRLVSQIVGEESFLSLAKMAQLFRAPGGEPADCDSSRRGKTPTPNFRVFPAVCRSDRVPDRWGLPGGEADHFAILDRHEVTADGPVGRSEDDSLGGGFQRLVPCETARRRTRTGSSSPRRSRREALVEHYRLAPRLPAGPPRPCEEFGPPAAESSAQSRLGLIGTAVGNDEREFHALGASWGCQFESTVRRWAIRRPASGHGGRDRIQFCEAALRPPAGSLRWSGGS